MPFCLGGRNWSGNSSVTAPVKVPPTSHPLVILPWPLCCGVQVFDCCFLADILVSFRTGYHAGGGHIETDGYRVARKYLLGGFAIDLLGSFPLNFFLTTSADGTGGDTLRLNRNLRLLRIFKLNRLLRLSKLSKVPGLMD